MDTKDVLRTISNPAAGAVDSSATPGHAKEFADQYGCRSEGHALGYLTPFDICAAESR